MAKSKIQKRMLPASPESTAERDVFISGGKAKQPLASKKPRAGTSSLLKKTQKGKHKRLMRFPLDLDNNLRTLSERTGLSVQEIVITLLRPVVATELEKTAEE